MKLYRISAIPALFFTMIISITQLHAIYPYNFLQYDHNIIKPWEFLGESNAVYIEKQMTALYKDANIIWIWSLEMADRMGPDDKNSAYSNAIAYMNGNFKKGWMGLCVVFAGATNAEIRIWTSKALKTGPDLSAKLENTASGYKSRKDLDKLLVRGTDVLTDYFKDGRHMGLPGWLVSRFGTALSVLLNNVLGLVIGIGLLVSALLAISFFIKGIQVRPVFPIMAVIVIFLHAGGLIPPVLAVFAYVILGTLTFTGSMKRTL